MARTGRAFPGKVIQSRVIVDTGGPPPTVPPPHPVLVMAVATVDRTAYRSQTRLVAPRPPVSTLPAAFAKPRIPIILDAPAPRRFAGRVVFMPRPWMPASLGR